MSKIAQALSDDMLDSVSGGTFTSFQWGACWHNMIDQLDQWSGTACAQDQAALNSIRYQLSCLQFANDPAFLKNSLQQISAGCASGFQDPSLKEKVASMLDDAMLNA